MTNDRVLPPVILFLTSFCILDSSFFLPFKPVLSYFSSLSSSCSSFLFFPAFLLLPIGFWPSVTLLKLPTTATPPPPPPPPPPPRSPPSPPVGQKARSCGQRPVKRQAKMAAKHCCDQAAKKGMEREEYECKQELEGNGGNKRSKHKYWTKK